MLIHAISTLEIVLIRIFYIWATRMYLKKLPSQRRKMKKINLRTIPFFGQLFSRLRKVEVTESTNKKVLPQLPASSEVEPVDTSFISGRFRDINTNNVDEEFVREYDGSNLETLFEKIARLAKEIHDDVIFAFSGLANRKRKLEELQNEVAPEALISTYNQTLEDALTAMKENWAIGFNTKLDAESKVSALNKSRNEAAEDYRLLVIGIAGYEKAVIKIQSKLVKISNRVAFAIAIITFEALLGFETFQGAGSDQMAFALSVAFGGALYILSILGADKSSIVSHHIDSKAVFNRNYRDTEAKRTLPENQGIDTNGKVVKFYELSDKTYKSAKRFTQALGALSIALLALRGFIIYRDETLGLMGLIGTAGLLLATWIFYGLDYVYGPKYEDAQLEEYSRKLSTTMGISLSLKALQQNATKNYDQLMDKLKQEYQGQVTNAKVVFNNSIENFRNVRIAYQKLRRQYTEAMKSFETGFKNSCDFTIVKIEEVLGIEVEQVDKADLLKTLYNFIPNKESLGDDEFDRQIAQYELPSVRDPRLNKPLVSWSELRKTIEMIEIERRRKISTKNIA